MNFSLSKSHFVKAEILYNFHRSILNKVRGFEIETSAQMMQWSFDPFLFLSCDNRGFNDRQERVAYQQDTAILCQGSLVALLFHIIDHEKRTEKPKAVFFEKLEELLTSSHLDNFRSVHKIFLSYVQQRDFSLTDVKTAAWTIITNYYKSRAMSSTRSDNTISSTQYDLDSLQLAALKDVLIIFDEMVEEAPAIYMPIDLDLGNFKPFEFIDCDYSKLSSSAKQHPPLELKLLWQGSAIALISFIVNTLEGSQGSDPDFIERVKALLGSKRIEHLLTAKEALQFLTSNRNASESLKKIFEEYVLAYYQGMAAYCDAHKFA